MSKDKTINSLKMLALQMIKGCGYGDSKLVLSNATLFKVLFSDVLMYDIKNDDWINRDRLIVSNRFMPLYYASLYMFTNCISKDELNEYKKYGSNLTGFSNPLVKGVSIASSHIGDEVPLGVGVALGEKYLNSMVKSVNPKSNLVDFKTYVVCNEEELMMGSFYESLSLLSHYELNNLVILCSSDKMGKDSSLKDTFSEDYVDRFNSLGMDVIEVKNGCNESSLRSAILDAKSSKIPTIVIYKTVYGKDSSLEDNNSNYNMPLSDEEISDLYNKYKLDEIISDDEIKEIKEDIEKRVSKKLNKWKIQEKENLDDSKLKLIYEFLKTKDINILFNTQNIKLNDNYKEDLKIGNKKIFNIFASKSPFIFTMSDDNFIYTDGSITSSDIFSKDSPLGRNILVGSRTSTMGYIASGLSSLGFKVFVSSPLINLSKLLSSIEYNSRFNYNVTYLFTQTDYRDSYQNFGINPVSEINIIKNMKNIITFQPGDINEILGVYDILKSYNKTSVIIVDSYNAKRLISTNMKYVLAGAYRIRKERNRLDAIIISCGSLIHDALVIADDLERYEVDFRVVSMVSNELFELQGDKYKNGLIPKGIKTFVLTNSDNSIWNKYATSDEYIFGVNKYVSNGTKEELSKELNLDKDSILTKIVELLKS